MCLTLRTKVGRCPLTRRDDITIEELLARGGNTVTDQKRGLRRRICGHQAEKFLGLKNAPG